MNRRELGALGEALALRYMQERGFALLAKTIGLCAARLILCCAMGKQSSLQK